MSSSRRRPGPSAFAPDSDLTKMERGLPVPAPSDQARAGTSNVAVTCARYPAAMDWNIVWYVVAGIVIAVGIAGSILPNLPGIPVMFGGMLLAAWVGHFHKIPVWVVAVLGVLAAFSIVFDFLAGTYGAKRHGASKAAVWGALLGTIAGLFFGIPGIIFGPFAGAVIGQLISGGGIRQSAQVGFGTWVGLLIGTAAKLAVAFMMLGMFALALAY
jgi:uncharacterized protein